MQRQNYQTSTIRHVPAGQDLQIQTITNSANRATLRDGTSYPSEIPAAVRVNQHCGVSFPRKKQLFPSLPFAIFLSVCYTTTPSFPALLVSKLCPYAKAQHGSTPGQAHRRLGITEAFPPVRSPIRYEIQG